MLRRAGCKEDAGENELQQRMAMIEGMMKKLDEQERRFSAMNEQTMQKYADLQRQAAQVDTDELNAERQSVRAEYLDAAKKKLEETFGERYSLMRMMDSRRRMEKLTRENGDSGKAPMKKKLMKEEMR